MQVGLQKVALPGHPPAPSALDFEFLLELSQIRRSTLSYDPPSIRTCHYKTRMSV